MGVVILSCPVCHSWQVDFEQRLMVDAEVARFLDLEVLTPHLRECGYHRGWDVQSRHLADPPTPYFADWDGVVRLRDPQ